MNPPGHFSAERGKSLKRRPLPHTPIPLYTLYRAGTKYRAGHSNIDQEARAPGIHELLSVSPYLAAASPPVAVRVREIALTEEALQRVASDIPPILGGGIPNQWQAIQVPDGTPLQPQVTDLLLARISLSQRGRPSRVEILKTLTEDVATTLRGMVEDLYFIPPIEGADTETLVLIRSLNRIEGADPSRFLARRSSWVQQHARGVPGGPSPVTTILYVASEQVQELGKPLKPVESFSGLLRAVTPGSGWAENVVGLVWNSDARQFARTWIVPTQPR